MFPFLGTLALLVLTQSVPVGAHALVVASFEALVLEGDAAPGGGSFASFGAVAQNEATQKASQNVVHDVAFGAELTGGLAQSGVFVAAPGEPTRAIALEGDTAPGTGGLQTYLGFGTPDLLFGFDGDLVAFRATLSPGLASEGVFQDLDGVESAIALAGEAAPGTGDTFASFGDPRVSRHGGAVAFSATLTLGGSGVFVFAGGTLGAVALSGEPAPGVPGGSFVAFGLPDLSIADELAFVAVVDTGGPGFDFEVGIFRDSAGTGSLVALDGDPAPGGGVYDFFDGQDFSVGLSLLPTKLLVFADATRIFSSSVGPGGPAISVWAEVGAPAPGTGGTFEAFLGRPGCCAGDKVVFLASVAGGSAPQGIFTRRPGFEGGALALVGDSAPDTDGGTFQGFPFAPAIRGFTDTPGVVSFTADLESGSAASGVFQLPEPGAAAALLAGGLLLGALRRLRGPGRPH